MTTRQWPYSKVVTQHLRHSGAQARDFYLRLSTTTTSSHHSFPMATEIAQIQRPPQGLHKLPNELLLDVVDHLSPADLRRLGQVNRRLLYFVSDYLSPFQVGLTALPNELVLEVFRHLRQKDRSRLARTSHRFYPLIMDSIIRTNIQKRGSNLLCFAAQKNLKGLARRILQRGGNVDTYREADTKGWATPLVLAAFHGFGQMIKLLFQFGASQTAEKNYKPLLAALIKRHEHVALRLLRNLDATGKLHDRVAGATLQIAAGKKLAQVVQYLFERTPRSERKVDLDTSLYCILVADACREDICKRELHHDVYRIVELLLQHGADPDIPLGTSIQKWTSREASTRHPDPRVRALLSKAVRLPGTKDLPLQIGRSWNVPSHASLSTASQTEAYFVRLWDFFDLPDDHAPNGDDGNDHNFAGANTSREHDDHTPAGIRALREAYRGMSRRSDSNEPPSLTSFPQLVAPSNHAQSTARELWANASPTIRAAPSKPVPHKTPLNAKPKGKQKQDKTKPTQEEQFPELERKTEQRKQFLQLDKPQGITGKELWAALPKNGTMQSAKEPPKVHRKEEAEEHGGGNKGSKKKKKKKVWQPLGF
jgi:hypothetical protein